MITIIAETLIPYSWKICQALNWQFQRKTPYFLIWRVFNLVIQSLNQKMI